MLCPYCASETTRVVDSRSADNGSSIRRRRECEVCDRRFTTYERIDASLMVRKRDGSLQVFQREKLRDGILRALADHEPDQAEIDQVVTGIESTLAQGGREIPSDDIGRAVLDYLRGIDPAAYLRFASVYKDFKDLSDFEREVAALERQD